MFSGLHGELARQLGLGRSTVSRALSKDWQRHRIAAATRERVLVAAGRLAGVPADGLRLVGLLHGPRGLGVLGPYGRLPQYLAEAAIDQGAILTQIAVEDDRWERWQAGPGPRLWGAVVMMDYLLTAADALLPRLPARRVMYNHDDDLPLDRVIPDDAQGMALLIDHLVEFGHRQAVVLAHRESHHRLGPEVRHRVLLGRRDQLEWTLVATVSAVLAAVGRGVTAVVVHNDHDALRVAAALTAAGWVPGRNVSLASTCDGEVLEITDPPITAVAQDVPAMAAAVMDLLVAGPSPAPRRMVVAESLVVRRSTIPVR
jgi:DNA-binding LacI/PurR family transcriptional regulator